jgi:hypothetical protein
MGDVHCIHCRGPFTLIAATGDISVAYLCQRCFYIWQLNIGWNPFINRHDHELFTPRYA